MNNPHQNARTTVHSRALMVACPAEGRPVGQIAAELGALNQGRVSEVVNGLRFKDVPAAAPEDI